MNFFVSNKNPIAVLLLILFLGGVFSYSKMQSSLFPEITFPKIKIIIDNGLQPVNKMMVTVTKPVESAIKRVPDLKMVRSTTSRGSCEISAFMDWKANIDLSKQQIESAINQIKNQLPADVSISVEKMNPSTLPISGYVIEGGGRSNIELNLISNTVIKPYLSQVDGVSDIRVIGGKTKEYHLELIPQKMSALGITPNIITNALNQTNFITSNGFLTDYKRLYLTITDASVTDLEDLQNLVISNDGKRILRLQDIAIIKVAEQLQYIRINANGKSAILLAVIKQSNANLIDVSKNIEKKIEELNSHILPKGISLKPFYVQSDFVNDSIKSVSDSLWIGLLLAIIVAIIFLRSLKSSVVILLTIPITLSLTLIVLYVLGYNFNIMTLGAIAASIGLIIDDAIVVVEQIHRTHEEHPETETKDLLSESVSYLFPAMVGSSISTIVIFFPFVLLSGVAGAYFKILTDTMIITLVCSFFVTWIGLPVLYLLFSGKRKEVKKQKPIKKTSDAWISFFITKPYLSIIFVLSLIVGIYFISKQLETGFLPEMDEGTVVLDYSSPAGTSLDETDRMLREVEKLIIKVPEVESYSRRTGTQMGFFITEPNKGDYLIQLKKGRKRSTYEVINDIRQRIESSQPALIIDFGQVIGDMLGDLMSSVQPIEIKIYGNNQKVLNSLAEQVAELTSNVNGTADVFNGITIAGPSINIKPDNLKLAQYGITPSDFQSQLQTQLEGNIVGKVFEKEQLNAVRMVYPNAANTSLDNIKKGLVFLPNGTLVSIQQLATVSIEEGSAQIERENLQTMIPVTARLNQRDLGSVMKDIQHAIKTHIHLPQGYHISYGGAYQEQQKSFQELLFILLAAGLLIFTTLLFLFRDIKIALLILFVAALGTSGSIFALFITKTALNVGSYTGIIMIIGIIAENAIFTFLQFKSSEKTNTVTDAVIYSISTRLRPKLMTAIGAIMALLPIALGIGTGAQLHQPLAIAVIGGFLIALPLLLIVYPTFLRLIYKHKAS